MSRAETYLLAIAFVLFAALVIVIALGRIDARAITRLTEDKAALHRQVRHYRERNAELRDALDAQAAGEPSLTEAVTATIADLPLTYPGDPR
ncbi:hypothetical protein [Micromonospora sp. CB01531]|uniref:hypothetical protein n=1 Tax=Micromonospora sp. CB01531 TaxID=1718947 RepID=UPI00093F03B8|nr:hypothetical protein [Micromonospora sp. CB01531]OKI47203.1 hypothetical protein A6A27_10140 [Micromonospora sp. CB01531]